MTDTGFKKPYPPRDWHWVVGHTAENMAIGKVSNKAVDDFNIDANIAGVDWQIDNRYRAVPTQRSMVESLRDKMFIEVQLKFTGNLETDEVSRFVEMLCTFAKAKSSNLVFEMEEHTEYETPVDDVYIIIWFAGMNWIVGWDKVGAFGSNQAEGLLKQGAGGEMKIRISMENTAQIKSMNSNRILKLWARQNANTPLFSARKYDLLTKAYYKFINTKSNILMVGWKKTDSTTEFIKGLNPLTTWFSINELRLFETKDLRLNLYAMYFLDFVVNNNNGTIYGNQLKPYEVETVTAREYGIINHQYFETPS